MVKKQFDVIIIGSGLGGLSAGAKLAREGKKVLILEQYTTAGGCATTYQKKDYTLEISLHELDGLGKGDNKLDIFREFNVLQNVTFVKLPHFYRFVNGRIDITIPHDISKAIEVLTKTFPQEHEGIKKYFKKMCAISKEINRLPQQNWKWPLLLPFAPLLYPNLIFNLNKTVGDFLDAIITDSDLKLVLLGNLFYYHDDPYTMSLLYYSAGQSSYYTGGGYYIKGGSQKLSDYLVQFITDHNGLVLTGQLVTNIIIENDCAVGVAYRPTTDPSAKPINAYATAIIANASIAHVAEMLPDKEQTILEQKINNLQIANSFLLIYLGFKKDIKSLGNKHYTTIFFDQSIKTQKDIITNLKQGNTTKFWSFTDYSQINSSLAPAGKSVGTLATVDYAHNWDSLSEEEYEKKKNDTAQLLFNRMEKLVPGFIEAIDYYEISTPLTIMRYTLNPQGSVYGYAQTPQQAGIRRIANKSPIENLYFASAWTRPGGGYSAVIYSGWVCAKEILEKYKG